MTRGLREQLTGVDRLQAFLRESGQSEDILAARKAMIEGPHPPDDTVFDYAMGKLSPEAMKKWSKHIAHCPICSDRMILFRSVESDADWFIKRSSDEWVHWKFVFKDLEHSVPVAIKLLRHQIDEAAVRPGPEVSSEYQVLPDRWLEAESFLPGESVAVRVQVPAGQGNVSAFLYSDLLPVTLIFPATPSDEDTYVEPNKRKTFFFTAPQEEGLYRLKVLWTREDFLYPHGLHFDDLDNDPALQALSESLPLFDEDEWAMSEYAFAVRQASGQDIAKVQLPESSKIVAVRAVDPKATDSDSWTRLIFENLKLGIALYGWCCGDLRDLAHKRQRTAEEDDCWSHAKFLLDLKQDDFIIYVNIPEKKRCTIVRVTGTYWQHREHRTRNGWSSVCLLHAIGCEYVGVFDRDCRTVHPDLSRRLKLRGSHRDLTGMKDHVAEILGNFT